MKARDEVGRAAAARAILRMLAIVSVVCALIGAAGNAGAGSSSKQKKVDLNTAPLSEIERLPDVGTVLAQRIVGGRPYKSLKDLEQAGIPAATVKGLKGKVVFSRVKAETPAPAATTPPSAAETKTASAPEHRAPETSPSTSSRKAEPPATHMPSESPPAKASGTKAPETKPSAAKTPAGKASATKPSAGKAQSPKASATKTPAPKPPVAKSQHAAVTPAAKPAPAPPKTVAQAPAPEPPAAQAPKATATEPRAAATPPKSTSAKPEEKHTFFGIPIGSFRLPTTAKPHAEAQTRPVAYAGGTTAKGKATKPPAKGMVWVNFDTKLFHYEGDDLYGVTRHGMWLWEDQAVREGYRASRPPSPQ